MYFSRSNPSLSLQSSKLSLEVPDSMTTASPYNGYAGNGAAAFMNGSNQGSTKAFHVPKQTQPLFPYHPQSTHPFHHPEFAPPNGMANSPPTSTSHPPPSSLPQTFQHMSISQTSPLSTSLAAPSSSAGFDLQDVIAQYQSQPDLLKLILMSKLEEDKRKSEEAKLRGKEIDLLLLERDREYYNMRRPRSYSNGNRCDDMLLDSPGANLLKGSDHGSPSMLRNLNEASTSMQHGSSFQDNGAFHSMSGSPSPRATEFAIPIPIQPQRMRRGSSGSISSVAIIRERRDSAVGSLCSSVDDDKSSSESVISSFSPSMQSIHHQPNSPRQSSGTGSMASPSRTSGGDRQQSPDQIVSSPDATQSTEKRKRKRREMQAVTMIIETKEHPHLDNYLWKNNGNTTQKKTGNKSVYYKCSNSNKGCPVNKTVTNKENGTYLIKVRGDHLAECGRVKRIVNT